MKFHLNELFNKDVIDYVHYKLRLLNKKLNISAKFYSNIICMVKRVFKKHIYNIYVGWTNLVLIFSILKSRTLKYVIIILLQIELGSLYLNKYILYLTLFYM